MSKSFPGTNLQYIVDKITKTVKKHGKEPKFYFIIFIAIVFLYYIIMYIYPYVYANFSYYNTTEKRIEILEKMSELDKDKISSNDILQKEYDDILSEINTQKDKSINNINIIDSISYKGTDSEEINKINFWKFISGSILFILLVIFSLFPKSFNSFIQRIGAIILFIVLGAICGYISYKSIIFKNPLVNYISAPIIEGLILYFLCIDNKQTNNNIEDENDIEVIEIEET